ncbi:hypothetical protein AYO22_10966 [Fonsecaea multimorphosa]|nr:hypothetical protein AYO22_10966 [Fonsecaea multimorphosa]
MPILGFKLWSRRFRVQSVDDIYREEPANLCKELNADRQSMDQKYAQLLEQYQEKGKKQAQTQKLYDILKQRVMMEKMEPLADNDVTQTLQSINILPQIERTQPAVESRQTFRAPDPLPMADRSISRYGQLQDGPERLHPHQRSGSSVSGSEQRGMLPPERLRVSRTRRWPNITNVFVLTCYNSEPGGHFKNALATNTLASSASSGCQPISYTGNKSTFSASRSSSANIVSSPAKQPTQSPKLDL